jgi:hypothetical protein
VGGIERRRRKALKKYIFPYVAIILPLSFILFSCSNNEPPARLKSGLKAIEMAIYQYAEDTGELPTRLNDLFSQPTAFVNWQGPYIELTDEKHDRLKDPWGREYLFLKGSGCIAIGSFGEDGQPGGKPDHFIYVNTEH